MNLIQLEPEPLRVRELQESDLPQVKAFTDIEIGQGYFTLPQLHDIFCAGRKDGLNASFLLVGPGNKIMGVRLSFMPGQWLTKPPNQRAHSELWSVPYEAVGYFQSLFVSEKCQGGGWGRRLSMASIENMKLAGAKAVVCHSWNESPNNSSARYLKSLNFTAVTEIPNFWKPIDYECTRCGRPCLCTATEMILYFEQN